MAIKKIDNWVKTLDKGESYEKKQVIYYSSIPGKFHITPKKNNLSDVGIDIFGVDYTKIGHNLYRVGTGISLRPSIGHYIRIFPRSSLVKSGYMMCGTGIIDPGYTGEIMINLYKYDPNAKDLKDLIPFRFCQAILDKFIDVELEETNNIIGNTQRGHGAFGSTETKN